MVKSARAYFYFSIAMLLLLSAFVTKQYAEKNALFGVMNNHDESGITGLAVGIDANSGEQSKENPVAAGVQLGIVQG